MVHELGRAAKKFAGLKASDAISKEKSRCEASDRLGRDKKWCSQISEETLRNGANRCIRMSLHPGRSRAGHESMKRTATGILCFRFGVWCMWPNQRDVA